LKTHAEIQGTNSWLALRRDYFTASEAPAMMGVSPHCTRTELLHAKKTGITPEIDARTQERFDDGLAKEAAFRPHAEALLGQDLYPVTGSLDVDGLKLLASFDGLTADDMIGFEHKVYNKELVQAIELDGELPPAYYWQLEQQLLISGANYILFVTSNGTKNKFAALNYTSQPDRREALIAAWKQFEIDLANYVPETKAAPAPAGRAPETLPALHIELSGVVTASNLQVYKDTALAVFKGINRELTTDQQFSDAEKTVKWCGEIEDRIKAAKQHALSQTESIDLLFRTMDEISEEARTVRLELDKLVNHRKEAVRTEIVNEGRVALVEHVESLNKRLGYPYLPGVPADFAGAIKGKKSLDSMRNAVSVTLANAKIEANRRADAIDVNVKLLAAKAVDCMSLFPDANQLVLINVEMFALKVDARITAHKAAEQKRLDDERERIRAEEVKKLADAAALEAKRLTNEETARVAREAAAQVVTPPVAVAPAVAAPVATAAVVSPVARSMNLRNTYEPSATIRAFLASRQWAKGQEATARAILSEYENFCAAGMMKVAA